MNPENEIKKAQNTVDREGVLKRFEVGEIKIAMTEMQAKSIYDSSIFEQSRAEYEFIKTAIEKQIPKKPVLHQDEYYYEDFTLVCPNCAKQIVNVWSKREYKPRFCHYCGQALDWRTNYD